MDSAMPAISGGMPSSLITPRRSSAAPRSAVRAQTKNSATLCQGAILKCQNKKKGSSVHAKPKEKMKRALVMKHMCIGTRLCACWHARFSDASRPQPHSQPAYRRARWRDNARQANQPSSERAAERRDSAMSRASLYCAFDGSSSSACRKAPVAKGERKRIGQAGPGGAADQLSLCLTALRSASDQRLGSGEGRRRSARRGWGAEVCKGDAREGRRADPSVLLPGRQSTAILRHKRRGCSRGLQQTPITLGEQVGAGAGNRTGRQADLSIALLERLLVSPRLRHAHGSVRQARSTMPRAREPAEPPAVDRSSWP